MRGLVFFCLFFSVHAFASGPHGGHGAAADGLIPEATAAQVAEPPKGARVFFANIKDGQTVPAKVKIKFGLEGMGLRPALQDVHDTKTGHHHLIINGQPVARGGLVPTDERHLHFGQGQSEAEVTLPPGTHTLTLQFADGAHHSYGESMSATVKVKMERARGGARGQSN